MARDLFITPSVTKDSKPDAKDGVAAPKGSKGAQRTSAPVGDRLKLRKRGNNNEEM